MTPINTSTNTAGAAISGLAGVFGAAVAPNRQRLYVTNLNASGTLFPVTLPAGTTSVPSVLERGNGRPGEHG